MKYPKYYTVKEWNTCDDNERFVGMCSTCDFMTGSPQAGIDHAKKSIVPHVVKIKYMTQQEILLQKYDVILTDWKSKREKTIENLHKIERGIGIGLKNFYAFSESLNKKPAKKRTRKKR